MNIKKISNSSLDDMFSVELSGRELLWVIGCVGTSYHDKIEEWLNKRYGVCLEDFDSTDFYTKLHLSIERFFPRMEER